MRRRELLLDDDFIGADPQTDLHVARLQTAKTILQNQLKAHNIFNEIVEAIKLYIYLNILYRSPDILSNGEKRLIYSLSYIFERGSYIPPELCISLLEDTVLMYSIPMSRNTQIIFDVLRERIPLSNDDIEKIINKYKIPYPKKRDELYPSPEEKRKMILRGYIFPYAERRVI